MRVESVGSAAASSARSVGMELWRQSMTQRVSHEMQQRITGQGTRKQEHSRRVEPAVRVEISDQARSVANKPRA